MAEPFLSSNWFTRARCLAGGLASVPGSNCIVQFRLRRTAGDLLYYVTLRDGRVAVLDRGAVNPFDVSVVETLETATAVHVTGEMSLADGVASGAIEVTGSSQTGLETFANFLARNETVQFMESLRLETLPFQEGLAW